MNEMVTAHEPSITNPADIATKVLPGGHRRDTLVSRIIYNVKEV
jgi:hypothetical protein